jgi:hypothetical protein
MTPCKTRRDRSRRGEPASPEHFRAQAHAKEQFEISDEIGAGAKKFGSNCFLNHPLADPAGASESGSSPSLRHFSHRTTIAEGGAWRNYV